ncbi:MAG: TrkH family potassium uptake protein [Planctomycetes bacterium]|nr:TrkH family potassium uptake protein [Planctomycetota bacterium]
MRFSFARLHRAVSYVGSILLIFAFLLLIPFAFSFVFAEGGAQDVRSGTYAIPILVSLLLGSVAWRNVRGPRSRRRMGTPEAMLICVFSWVAISAVGAIPFSFHLGLSYLDAYFEAMSGFTTTGITMLRGLDVMPKSLILWRAMAQWIGGLGILTFFLVVLHQGGLSRVLFAAESHKIRGERIAPGMWNTLKIMWLIYSAFTLLLAIGLRLCGVSFYDVICHAFTCLSTGGYSPYDASIAHYEQAGYAHHVAIEYLLILGMWAGGTSFLVHYRVLTGRIKALWESDEMKAWWLILGVSVALVFGSRLMATGMNSVGESFRHSLFQVTSIATSTGYATRDVGGHYFTPLARLVFLTLMLVGGCAGSTAGGLKVIRIVILWKLMRRQVRRSLAPPDEVQLLLVDGRKVPRREIYRTAALLFAWVALLLFGALTTAALSGHDALSSASGMFSALGNIGPCYISVEAMMQLSPVIKLVYIMGMLAGRLEILPLLILFSRRSWH